MQLHRTATHSVAIVATAFNASPLNGPPPPQPLQQPAEQCHTKALLPLKHRQLFGQLLEREGATVGAGEHTWRCIGGQGRDGFVLISDATRICNWYSQ